MYAISVVKNFDHVRDLTDEQHRRVDYLVQKAAISYLDAFGLQPDRATAAAIRARIKDGAGVAITCKDIDAAISLACSLQNYNTDNIYGVYIRLLENGSPEQPA